MTASALLEDPQQALTGGCYYDFYKLDRSQTEAVQLAWVRRRFADLRPQLSVLDKLAAGQHIEAIASFDDLAPLLFAHTVYKSYPLAHLERGNFQRLTRWLDGLTTCDLRNLDVSGIDSIDGWLDRLDSETPLRVFHGSGTTGKLAFIPRTAREYDLKAYMCARVFRDHFGPNSGPDVLTQVMPLVSPGYEHGAGNTQRTSETRRRLYAGGREQSLYMYPGERYSADVASLAGRLRGAATRGEQGDIEVSPSLLLRREEALRRETERPAKVDRFFATAAERFGGRDVQINAVWPTLFEMTEAGLKRGYRGLFGAGSIVITGGGSKGRVLPDDWREQITAFLGFETAYYERYGMSEWISVCWRCEHGNYHIPPTLVSFVLDPATGQPLPRTDGQTGRYAAYDILCDTYWAGLVTGDEVTLGGWEADCACGRRGLFVLPSIRRYSEIEGGDDRVLCSGAPEAHDKALEFLAQLSG